MKLSRESKALSGEPQQVAVRLRNGFSLVELLVIIAIIGVLASLLLPALSRAKSLAQRTACLANMKQFGLSWALYSEENDGLLVESYPGTSSTSPNPYAWVQGNMQNPNETGDTSLLKRGKLYSNIQNANTYHCPADTHTIQNSGQTVSTVRSYSMNAFMGDRSRFGNPINMAIPLSASGYVPYFKKDSDITQPSSLWVMIDEDERTISSGFFTFDPRGKPTNPQQHIPASRHNLAYSLNFADGHAEIWRFSDPNSSILANNGPSLLGFTPDNADLKKLGAATATQY